MALRLVPVSLQEAKAFVAERHRHHKPPVSWKFGMGVHDGEKLVGVAMVSRPVARMSDDGKTLEVSRCCTDGTKNACSMLYGAAWRAAQALGYERLITYTLAEENGASLRACGWKQIGIRGGGEWSRASRPANDDHPLGPKTLWEAA